MNETVFLVHVRWMWGAIFALASALFPLIIKSYFDLRSRIDKNTEKIAENEKCSKVQLAETKAKLTAAEAALSSVLRKIDKG